jgi:hypothetical protein
VTVHFVGAGPGAADLITVRAQRLLAECAVCLYAGSLVPAEVLAHCPPGARLIDTADLTLDEIVAAMTEADAAGCDVVRLCSGDPAVFSAIAEQARRLDQAGIGYDITPGVPAFAAAGDADATGRGPGQPRRDRGDAGAAPGRAADRAGRGRADAALRARLPGGGGRLRQPGRRDRAARLPGRYRRPGAGGRRQEDRGDHRGPGAGGGGVPRQPPVLRCPGAELGCPGAGRAGVTRRRRVFARLPAGRGGAGRCP